MAAHEFGHSVHQWLDHKGLKTQINEWLLHLIRENTAVLETITRSSFEYSRDLIPREIFAELFAADRVLNAVNLGKLTEDLLHPALKDDAVKALMEEFSAYLLKLSD